MYRSGNGDVHDSPLKKEVYYKRKIWVPEGLYHSEEHIYIKKKLRSVCTRSVVEKSNF